MEKKRDRSDEHTSERTHVTSIAEVDEGLANTEACLVIIYGGELGKKFLLEAENTILGRGSVCDIRIDEEEISRKHCKFVNRGAHVEIRDLESTHGSFVNDRQVTTETLRDGDLVKVGRTILKFLSSGNIEHAYHEEIYNLSTTDGLTQVYNRRYLLDNLDREISRSRRNHRDVSLIIIDLDHFKRINDIFGHLAGDYVLKLMSTTMRANLRLEDILARYGGEEFVVILPEVNRRGAIMCAEKLRRLVETTEFVFDGARLPVTISLGVATAGPETRDGAQLIKLADEQLYEAKRLGRNRVVAG